ncbi:Tn3 family transposase, partial [Polaromonas sp.]|uniref:Tn3 family transposase n=1 Tax=Polaromonas sp. TaxID=1869339 RepID=UPI003BB7D5C1
DSQLVANHRSASQPANTKGSESTRKTSRLSIELFAATTLTAPEYDKLIRTIYTLRYLRDPQLQRDVHRSENRIESYHQLRSTIAQVNGKKELTGRTDLDVDISNHCGRLIANVVIAFNSMLLSGLLSRSLATGNEKAMDLLRRISPAAWQHIHFLGHYAFRDKRTPIDLDAILAGIDWE